MSILAFGALMMLVGWQEGYAACKQLSVGMLVTVSESMSKRFEFQFAPWPPTSCGKIWNGLPV